MISELIVYYEVNFETGYDIYSKLVENGFNDLKISVKHDPFENRRYTSYISKSNDFKKAKLEEILKDISFKESKVVNR